MTPQQIHDQAIRIEGFNEGYRSCLQWVSNEMAKEEQTKKDAEKKTGEENKEA